MMNKQEQLFLWEPSDYAAIGAIPPGGQVTLKDTCWSEQQKEEMRAHGFDGVDMIEAWYS
ncbi:MAG: hypothetical protein J5960_00615 [Desulfovibrio sp.]|nr:hypothetical protein [Desulfovibrio sp.]